MEISKIYQEQSQYINKEIKLQGWVRFNRPSKNIGFIELTDGTNLNGIQLVYKAENEAAFQLLSSTTLFSVISVTGTLIEGKGGIEVEVSTATLVSQISEDFPIGKKEHGLEFLRDVAHLRIRTKLFQSIMKIRSTLSFAIHEFYNENGYTYVHTPIITSNDAEGAGEEFKISSVEKIFNTDPSLTVSGQLHAESYVQSLSKVYSFGPTFRAENSNTTRHASEFWMLEPEVAFADGFEVMDMGEALLKFVISKVIEKNKDELEFLEKNQKEGLIASLQNILDSDINRISYKQALEILSEADKEFEINEFNFGLDLSTEHERYLAEEKFNGPVYVYNYPASIKAFYMKQNDDDTVMAYDLLVPGIGELIGGSEREMDINKLNNAAASRDMDISGIEWYTQLRNQGCAKSAGFGLGFERLVMLVTGTENIRDVLPFPRTPGQIKY